MKVRIIAIAVGLFIVAGAQANQITFRGVVTSAVGYPAFSRLRQSLLAIDFRVR